MKKETVGYTNGYFDLFHKGHLNLIRCAAALCDRLIVGVLTDEVSMVSKHKNPIIPFVDRVEIVGDIKGVDLVVPVGLDDKYLEWEKYRYDILVVGTDHKGTHIWNQNEARLRAVGVNIVYIPYTQSVSTTEIIEQCRK